ncbi:MAG TPA: TolC family protein, partial [Pirellulales bacterium]|nr:TolC family protein [Pirellulales bacterium]
LCFCVACHCVARVGWSQVASLADDVIIAAQGKENAERNRKTALGRIPGTAASPYQRSPGSNDILLGQDPNRRLAPLRRLTRRPYNPSEFRPPTVGSHRLAHGLAPAIERLQLPAAPSAELVEPSGGPRADLAEDVPPASGLSLDEAINRLIRANRDLRTKSFEIPQAEADVLTAGLRSNPLFFYSADSVPYGSYSPRRPGEINQGISAVYPLDYSGKRRSRVDVAEAEKRILRAQYQDAVRQAIDDLYTAYVDALAARQAVRAAERSLGLIDELLRAVPAGKRRLTLEEQDDLTIERDLAAMSIGDAREQYWKAKLRLGTLLDLPIAEIERLELRGSVRELGPQPPPVDQLIDLAVQSRPDLAAHRLGVERARAELKQERAEVFSDAYVLYTPFQYRNNSQMGQQNATGWGAGVFASAPLFNRNQGNLQRANLNIAQSQSEAAAHQQQVVAEVRQAAHDFENTCSDLQRLEQVTLPAIRRKRDAAWSRLRAGEIDVDAFLAVQRNTTSLVHYYRDTLVRHRRHALRLNTAVGRRILP